ncbi:MAG: hypothetical protein ISS82_02800 [Nanoarchaeota archaeon]|nr:hypothetical protein [Nanoarchaeota archaeon]
MKIFSKKSQSAMEYLMTYGWAILIILIAVGALFYLGVFSPSTPSTCQMSAPFNCQDVKVSETPNELQLAVGATGVDSVTYTNVNSVININGDTCVITYDGDPIPDNLDLTATNLQNGQIVTIKCVPGLAKGDKYTGTITLTYTLSGSDLSHTTSGQFSGTVE